MERKEYLKGWANEHPESIRKSKEKFYRNHPNYRPPHDKESQKKYKQKVRAKTIELLGGKCSNPNCLVPNGCTDIRCLQIDHVKGGGNKALKSSYKEYKKIYMAIRSGSKDYQLLCANCNWIKFHENKEWLGSRSARSK